MSQRREVIPADAELALRERIRRGDKQASSEIFRLLQPAVRTLVRRLVGQPDDTDDLVQDTLVEGITALGELQPADRLQDRLEEVAARIALAHLAEQRRWRPAAQIHAQAACESEDLSDQLRDILSQDEVAFDVREHIAFCLTCVGRSLPLEQHVAVVLCDVMGFDIARAAALAAVDEKNLRAYLEAGRASLGDTFDKLCRLSSDEGACDQCRGLRDAAPDGRKGPVIDGTTGMAATLSGPIPAERLFARMRAAQAADVDRGVGQELHDQLFRLVARIEHDRTTPPQKDDVIPPGRARWEFLQSRNN